MNIKIKSNVFFLKKIPKNTISYIHGNKIPQNITKFRKKKKNSSYYLRMVFDNLRHAIFILYFYFLCYLMANHCVKELK